MDRRAFLSGAFGVAALAPREAAATTGPTAPDAPLTLRGSIDANSRALSPNAPYDQSRLLQALLREAAAENKAVFLPPGRYRIADIVLPARTRLSGIAGATELVFAGGEQLITAENAETVTLSGLVLDGDDLPLADYVPGLVHIASTETVAIENCEIRRSAKAGLVLDRSAGLVERVTVRNVAGAAIRATESTGLSVTGNRIAGCGAGILVWRWTEGEDGTMVSGNRIERIGAGAGETGDGISVFRAHGAMIAANRIAGCAAAAIRAHAADGIQIAGNTCRDAREAGIVVSGFAGALVVNNVVDRCAAGISLPDGDAGDAAVVAGNMVRGTISQG